MDDNYKLMGLEHLKNKNNYFDSPNVTKKNASLYRSKNAYLTKHKNKKCLLNH
jgi:hypothetical protein